MKGRRLSPEEILALRKLISESEHPSETPRSARRRPMNEIAASLSVALLRMSLFLAAAAIAVQLLLKTRPRRLAADPSLGVAAGARCKVGSGGAAGDSSLLRACSAEAGVFAAGNADHSPGNADRSPGNADPIAGTRCCHRSNSPAKTIPWHVVRPCPLARTWRWKFPSPRSAGVVRLERGRPPELGRGDPGRLGRRDARIWRARRS